MGQIIKFNTAVDYPAIRKVLDAIEKLEWDIIFDSEEVRLYKKAAKEKVED